MRDSVSDDEVEIVSPKERSPMTSIAEMNDQINEVMQEGRKIERIVPDPFKKSKQLVYSPPKMMTKVAAEVTKKSEECPSKALLKGTTSDEAASASTSTAVPAREPTRLLPVSPLKLKYKSTEEEVDACYKHIIGHVKNSRNLKTEIKNGVEAGATRLYKIAKKVEKALRELRDSKGTREKDNNDREQIKRGVQLENQETEVQENRTTKEKKDWKDNILSVYTVELKKNEVVYIISNSCINNACGSRTIYG
ncbi:hypothetical protein K1T71_010256 [Dendrolimus kikuchii]|uniref:Uncharacterized protein n=1 Tax=Dendrolimus kikuchii TaxID=765133 RepID=A0ACC1CRQ8_9NEOP|nr:hypothetical protein K1T71_010256 [Dendrolimus kikuchii]